MLKNYEMDSFEYRELYKKLEQSINKTIMNDEVLLTQLKTVPETLGLILVDKGFNIVAESNGFEQALAIMADIVHHYSAARFESEKERNIHYAQRSKKVH